MRTLAAAALTLMLMAASGARAVAEEPAPAADDDKYSIKKSVYYYSSNARRDPFASIIEIAKMKNKDAKVKERPPTESYDLKQMRLIAILKSPKRALANILLPDGKYYTVYIGDALGIHEGFIEDITNEYVVVREKERNFKGELTEKDSFLKLREEE